MTRKDQEGRVPKIEAADPYELIENVGRFTLFGSAGVVRAGLQAMETAKWDGRHADVVCIDRLR